MTYPVSDRIVNILQQAYQKTGPRKHTDRGNLCVALGDQNYHGIWIDSAGDYKNISQHLFGLSKNITKQKKHIIIYQTEEDWFRTCDFKSVRNTIKRHRLWTNDSFIITNSRQDKQQTKNLGINAVCRPGMLDLITYRPYNIESVKLDNITHHTGVCWSRYESDRLEVVKLLQNHQERVIVAKLGSSWENDSFEKKFVINQANTDIVELLPDDIDAPFQPIESDLWWAANIAFGTVIESHHRSLRDTLVDQTRKDTKSLLDTNLLTSYTPTTSEKTYRNMHLLRPAVICGGQHTRQYLLDLGFDTWDWFVDWSFDAEPDDGIRFSKFIDEINRLLNTPLEVLIKLINDNRDKLLHNRDRLFWLINNYDTIDI
jgi:hypothetical protein